MGDDRRLRRVEYAAEMFDVTPYTIRQWLNDPNVSLTGFKLKGGQWRIKDSELERFAQERHGGK